MNSKLDDLCPEFSEAAMYWHLDQLYQDLARFKGKPLSNREKQWLRGLLLGYSPREINRLILGCSNSKALRPGLAQKLYPLIKQLLYENTKQEVQLGTCCIPILMEKLGYRKALMKSVRRVVQNF
jgi:hypothetical protein